MWTSESRGRMAKIRKKLKRYPTDLTDEEWSVIAPLFPAPSKKGRPRKTDLREVVNAIRYLVRTGCGWEMLPSDFPPWQTVYWWFRRIVRRLLFGGHFTIMTVHLAKLVTLCDTEPRSMLSKSERPRLPMTMASISDVSAYETIERAGLPSR